MESWFDIPCIGGENTIDRRYIETPIHGILNPLPMGYSYGIMNPLFWWK
jgi:hypothetical protein